MPSIDRRTLLGVAATGSIAALAGCSSSCPDSGTPEPDALVEVDGASRPFERAPATNWPVPRYDAGNTGYAPEATPPNSPLGVRWQTALSTSQVEGTNDRASAPAVADGLVMVATGDGVSALRFRDGKEAWHSTAVIPNTVSPTHGHGDEIAPPVVGANDTAFVGGQEALVSLATDDGTTRWRYEERERFGTPVVHDGAVYAGSGTELVAVDAADGTELWSESLGFEVGLPAVAGETVVAAGDETVALSAATGERRWQTRTGTEFYPVVADGTVYLGEDLDGLHAFDLADGTRRWLFERGGSRAFAPPIVAPETLYVVERPPEAEMATFALDRTDGEPEPRWCSELREGAVTAVAGDLAFGLRLGGGTSGRNGGRARLLGFEERFGNAAWGLASSEQLLPPAVVDGAVVTVDASGNVLAVGEA